MNEKQLATDKKMRGLAAEMTRDEGLKMLEVMLERSTSDEIALAIQFTKGDYEVVQVAKGLLP